MNSFGKDLIEGFDELADALENGQKISKNFGYNKRVLNLKPAKVYSAELVKETREEILNVSQAIFSEFFGVSVKTVQAWEQGANPVNPAVCRFLDEIRNHPEFWQDRFKELILIGSE